MPAGTPVVSHAAQAMIWIIYAGCEGLQELEAELLKFEIISCCHHVVFKYSPKCFSKVFRRSFLVKVF